MRGLRHDIGSWSRLGSLGRVVLAALAAVVGVLVWTGLAGGTQPYATYESTVAVDGPVAQYRFDDAVGSSTLADSAGSYTATNSGIVLGGEGPFGGSRSGSFGGSAFASLPSNPLAGASAFSAEGWVDWTGGSSYKQPIFDFGSSSTNYMYLTPASSLTSHTMLFEIRTTSGTVFQVTAPTLKSKAWEYVAVTETSSGTLTLYLNGAQVGETTGATITPSSLGSLVDEYLGKSLVSGEPSFNGSMSNVAFYDKALTAEQIKAHYNAAKFPVNTVLPTVSGTPEDGQTLTAAAGTWTGLTPITYTYQWTLCEPSGAGCANIASATKTTYKAIPEDVGRTLRIAVTASNSAGSSSASSNQTATVAPLPPANTKLPALSGTAKDGQVLTVSNGTWTGTPPLSYAYQWEACNSSGAECAGIPGATASTYRVITSEIGGTLRAVVTASNAGGSASATSAVSAVIVAGVPVNTALPEVSGTAMEGQTLSASTGTWAGTAPFTYTYQWEKCNSAGESCANLTGATKATYVLSSSNLGTTLRVIVTAKNASGSAKATSAATAVVVAKAPANTALPVISGTATDGQVLTTSTGSWSGVTPFTYTYQWQRCNSAGESCSNISGATGSTYVLAHGDVGSTLRATVTAKNTAGSASASSAATPIVAALAPSNTTAPAITGTATDGQTLSVSTGEWAGTPPLTYTYQWQSCNSTGESCSSISGATSSTYVLGHSDVATTLRVTVTASNTAGSASSTSEATGTVAALAPSNAVAPTIAGTATDGQTLTAATGTWNGTPPLSYAYQWESCNSSGEACSNISEATGSSYVLGHGDVGTTLRVVVTATNSAGSAPSTSEATSVVAALAPSNTAPPAISGEAKQGQTLTAGTGSWTGTPPLTYSYQWESCDSLGEGCLDISGATSASYPLGAGEVGDTVRVVVTAINAAGSASSTSEATAVVTGSSGCTDTWTGDAGDSLWRTAGNWSTGTVPGSSDTACVGVGTTVHVTGGTVSVGSVEDKGTLEIFGGTLELSDAAKMSSVTALTLGNATLTGPGSLEVSSGFSLGAYGIMSGSGSTVIGASVAGRIEASSGCEPMRLAGGRTLVNEGTLTFGWGTLYMSEGARLENKGTFNDITEASCEGAQIQSPSGSGAASSVLNTGTFEKTSGGGTSTVAVNFSDQGSVLAKAGTLDFGDGGIPEEVALGSWSTQSGGHIALSGGTFLIGEEVNLSAVRVEGATVVRVGSGPPSSSSPPTISGEPFTGQTLKASTGSWTGKSPLSYNYQWQSCDETGGECANIAGASGQSYVLESGEVGSTVRVLVTATNTLGSASAGSHVTAVIATPVPPSNVTPPAISGTAQDGQTLSANRGTWTGVPAPSYSYQWQSCDSEGTECSDIEGATGATYFIGHGEVGMTLRVRVEASNLAGSAASTSEATSVVVPLAPVNTEPPRIYGIPQDEETLSAGIGEWEGTPPLTYTYQWQSCNSLGVGCMDILGATSSTYTPGGGEVGSTLQVTVTATNATGTASSTSAVTAAVLPPPPASTIPPVITGVAEVGQTLSADTGTWEGAAPLTYSYQWQRCNSSDENCTNITGATNFSYVPTVGVAGSTLQVTVTATNAGGSTSSSSEATDVVAAASGEAACTDVWIGAEYGLWQEASSWSDGSIPTANDVACIGPGTTISIESGTNQVGVLHDEGQLWISSGEFGHPKPSLEIMSKSELSTIGTLTLHGVVTGPGSVYISSDLEWEEGMMSGSGQTVVGPAASATFKGGLLTGRTLLNEGTLTFTSNYLEMSDGALLENRGIFKDNAETCAEGCGIPGQIFIPSKASSAALGIRNTGVFEKTQGSGTGTVAVPFGNEGAVIVQHGRLRFVGGGIAEQVAAGSWSVENSAAIALGAGSFLIGEGVDLSAVDVEEGATVTRGPVLTPSSSSSPTIAGQTVVGETLSASPGSWSGTLPLSYSYQWQRCNTSGGECANMAGATSSSYALGEADVGTTVRVLVTAGNVGGSASATSAPSAVIADAAPPANTTLPAVLGTSQDGQTLTAGVGSWSGLAPFTYSYQWESCNSTGGECAPIEYATGTKYELGEGDIGTTVRVVVTAINSLGSAQATSPASPTIQPEPPNELEAPSISGTPDADQVLAADPGEWAGTATEISYQWESCNSSGGECAPIEGATGPEYDLGEGDIATRLRVRIGAGNTRDSLTDVSAATPVIGAGSTLVNITVPSITGTPQSGQTLTVEPGSWSETAGVSYAYQWQTCSPNGSGCEAIEGATSPSYTPVSANIGSSLRVLATATGEHGSLSQISPATQPIAATQAPAIEDPPVISGTTLADGTLTATPGAWTGESPINYSYQWERCEAGGSCQAIEGATAASYTLTGSDVNSTLVALVSATNASGSSTGVSSATAVIGPESIVRFSAPSISGTVQVGGTLNADPGIWSAAGPVSYAYQWESCNPSGGECAPIEGANESSYTLSSGDLGSTLRVTVTVTNPLGNTSAHSAPTVVTPGGEVTVAQAEEIAQHDDPSLLAPSSTATLEEQTVSPGLSDGEEQISATGTLTSSTISKETPGEFAVNTPEGELSLTPLETSPNATTTPTIVNGAAAFFANTWPATDTIVRPDALGATTLLQLRSVEAPTSFSWEVGLGADQELRQLPGGAVAVVDPTEAQPEPTSEEEAASEGESESSGESEAETEGESGSESEPVGESEEGAEQSAGEKPEETETPEEAVPFEGLPVAPLSSTPLAETIPGQPQPQDTQAQYESGTNSMSSAEAQTGNNTLMVIAPPTVKDANGNDVPASYSVAGATITLTVKPSSSTTYPVLVDPAVAAPSDKKSKSEPAKIRYGLSDERPNSFTHSGPAPEEFKSFDKNLRTGPLKIKMARLVVRYDVLHNKTLRRKEEEAVKAGKKEITEPERLNDWLHAVKKEHLEPFITLKTNCFIAKHTTCVAPTVKEYEEAIKPLIANQINSVKHWGAWNEPDFALNPLHHDSERAAQFWEAAQSIVTNHCKACNVVAGEFAEDQSKKQGEYIEHYRNTLLCDPKKNPHCPARALKWPNKPHIWALHDYHDVVYGGNHDATEFDKVADTSRLGHPFIWLSEQGVELQTSNKVTRLNKEKASEASHNVLQRKAAFDFLHLQKGLKHIERLNYYMYSAPTQEEKTKMKNEHLFDSALLGEEDELRPAYCVLAYTAHKCPPTVKTLTGVANGSVKFGGGGGTEINFDEFCSLFPTARLHGLVNPNGSPTTYHFEYGGESTSPGPVGDGRAPVEVEAEAPLPTSGCYPMYFRVVATDAKGTNYYAANSSKITFSAVF